MLVHDRSTTHNNGLVRAKLQSLNLREHLMPPRSPDLQPLDYGVFSTSKNKLQPASERDDDWVQRVVELEKHIREADLSRIVAQFPLRLEACIRSGGGHIDEALKSVKHDHAIA
jgi:hypothetical protein